MEGSVIQPNGENSGGGVNYSTTEQRIGTWIDGKPLYQKTINFGQLPNSGVKTVNNGIANIDRIWVYDGYALNPTTGVSNRPVITNPSVGFESSWVTYVYGQYVDVVTGSDRTLYTECYITLRYTKTTD